jgi:hypothetical protein
LYLPRLKSREVLAAVVRTGSASRDFFGTAYGFTDGKYDGFQFGDGGVSLDDTLLLIEPEAAKQYAIALKKLIEAKPPEAGGGGGGVVADPSGNGATVVIDGGGQKPVIGGSGTATATKVRTFRGSVEVNAALAKSKLNTIAEEVIALLASDAHAKIRITLEIDAEFPQGARDDIKRGVSENANSLGFKTKDWE